MALSLYKVISSGARFKGLLFVLLMVAVAGCRRTAQRQKIVEKSRPAATAATLQDAVTVLDDMRLVDISVPIGAVVYEVTGGTLAQPGIMVARYESRFSIDMLGDFYHLDMERLGWQEHALFQQPHEALLLFEKPYRWCMVLIKHTSRGTEVSLYIRQKAQQGAEHT